MNNIQIFDTYQQIMDGNYKVTRPFVAICREDNKTKFLTVDGFSRTDEAVLRVSDGEMYFGWMRVSFESTQAQGVAVYYSYDTFMAETPDQWIISSLQNGKYIASAYIPRFVYRIEFLVLNRTTGGRKDAATAVKKIKIEGTNLLCNRMFDNGSSNLLLDELDLSGLDTSNITSFQSMFQVQSNLKSIGDVSSWNTSKVTSMRYTFYGCTQLEHLNVSTWDVSNVTDMTCLFYNCQKLKHLDISNWKTSKVTSFVALFNKCYNLVAVDVSNLDTSAVTTFNTMFMHCESLLYIDISKWNSDLLTGDGVYYMFACCKSLHTIDGLENLNMSNVTTLVAMLYFCEDLRYIGDISGWDTSKVTSMQHFISHNYKMKSLNLSGWDVSQCTDFAYCFAVSHAEYLANPDHWTSAFEEINLTGWSLGHLTDKSSVQGMFQRCCKLKRIVGGLAGLRVSIDLHWSPLTHDAAVEVIQSLGNALNTEQSIKLRTDTYNTLTDAEKQVATDKGWTIQYSNNNEEY